MTKTTLHKPVIETMNDFSRATIQTQLAKESEFDFIVGVHDMILDLKSILKEYYVGTLSEDGYSIKVAFNNGQKFRIFVETCA